MQAWMQKALEVVSSFPLWLQKELIIKVREEKREWDKAKGK